MILMLELGDINNFGRIVVVHNDFNTLLFTTSHYLHLNEVCSAGGPFQTRTKLCTKRIQQNKGTIFGKRI